LASLCLFFAPAMAGAATPQFNYLLHCGGCHIEDGSGMANVVPDLNEDLGYFANFPEGRAYLVRVPGASHSPLSDADLAEVMNWMLRTFAAADAPEPYSEAEVTAHRHVRMNDAQAVRRQLLDLKARPDAETSSVSYGNESHGKASHDNMPMPQAAADPVSSAAPQPRPLPMPVSMPMPMPLSDAQQLALGEALFFDTSLSRFGNQACASCHDPGRAFADPRSLTSSAGGSIGSDGTSIGHRNAPALTYIATTPAFSLHDTTQTVQPTRRQANAAIVASPADRIRGGFFWDGREPTLAQQVLTPFINPGEMGLQDLSELAARVSDTARYQDIFGKQATHLPEPYVLGSIADSLAAYLRSDTFNTYDSRYDRFVRGELTPTTQEAVGMGLFFSPGFTNCASCHQATPTGYAPGEPFTNHRYENIGTPVNRALLANTDLGEQFRDAGLGHNPALTEAFEPADVNGRFKVPSLRNVAVSGPYMHNGAFADLDTVMRFYNHYNESGSSGQINPETGQPWAASNHPDGVATDKLSGGFPLSDRQLAALTAFLRMLTDQRYEHLLP
tara:strand:+ start:1009 stop:2688 length:1680 start_codon:yes stop_codon:yes gene_type:complete